MAEHTAEHATGGGQNTTGLTGDRPSRAPATRNGVSIRVYENDPGFGQKMTEDGKVMFGSRPNAQ